MCIIVNKNRGIELPKMETLRNCFDYNNDGAGMMYNLNGKVYIEKGFMKFDEFYNRLMELDEKIGLVDRGLVMHFRISTSGLVDRGNCHPYPISKDVNELRALKFTTDLGMAHNGIMSKYTPSANSTMNDTQTFIKNYLTDVYKFDRNFLTNELAMQLIEIEVGSKLSFLDTEGNITTVGKFEEFEGCWYSNSTYQDVYSSSYWSKWCGFSNSWSSSWNSPSEFDLEDDLTPIANKQLELEEFVDVLDCLYIPCDGTEIELGSETIICNGNYGIDNTNNVFFIDYVGYAIEFLGIAWENYETNVDDTDYSYDCYSDSLPF